MGYTYVPQTKPADVSGFVQLLQNMKRQRRQAEREESMEELRQRTEEDLFRPLYDDVKIGEAPIRGSQSPVEYRESPEVKAETEALLRERGPLPPTRFLEDITETQQIGSEAKSSEEQAMVLERARREAEVIKGESRMGNPFERPRFDVEGRKEVIREKGRQRKLRPPSPIVWGLEDAKGNPVKKAGTTKRRPYAPKLTEAQMKAGYTWQPRETPKDKASRRSLEANERLKNWQLITGLGDLSFEEQQDNRGAYEEIAERYGLELVAEEKEWYEAGSSTYRFVTPNGKEVKSINDLKTKSTGFEKLY